VEGVALEDIFALSDSLGPLKVIHVNEPSIGLKAILVIDNVATGASIGGIRIAPDVTTRECVRLARAMTLKNAAAGLPHGGGKVVVYGDPKMPKEQKELLMRGLAQSLKEVEQYIFAPDMGTNEECMAWIKDEVDRVVGLPREIGGIPLDEIGATGWGLRHVTQIALQHLGIPLDGAKVAVQGFGSVGKNVARFLSQAGAVIIAAADTGGTVYNAEGLDIDALIMLKEAHTSVTACPDAEVLPCDAIIDIPCDIWIPAARPDVIHKENAHRLQAKLVVEGANIPVTHEAEKMLHDRGILCIPDFIANAGGVICAATEYHGATQTAAFEAIEEKLCENTRTVLKESTEKGTLPRESAVALAITRVEKAMQFNRFSLFTQS
jgi:glutamate dehydrogenase (NAD(P)+)